MRFLIKISFVNSTTAIDSNEFRILEPVPVVKQLPKSI